MKYLGMSVLLFFISTLNILGDEDFCDGVNVIFIQNLNVKQQKSISEMREKFLENFNEIREKIVVIRVETQIEMRKENPDWNKIKRLNKEYSKLQNSLNEGMEEYKNRIETIQVEFAN